MWFITQCFGVGFLCSHRAGDSVPLPGPPDPPDMAPDPHDEEDFEGPTVQILVPSWMSLWPRFPCFPWLFNYGRWWGLYCNNVSQYTVHYMLVPPRVIGFNEKTLSLFVIQLRCAVSCKRNVNGCLIPTGRLVIDARKRYYIYWLYFCHMTTSFHLYTDSILVIWRLHSIYILTLFLSYDDFIPSI